MRGLFFPYNTRKTFTLTKEMRLPLRYDLAKSEEDY